MMKCHSYKANNHVYNNIIINSKEEKDDNVLLYSQE